MLIRSRFWKRISAGIFGSAAVFGMVGASCFAEGWGWGKRDRTAEDNLPGGRQTEKCGKCWPPFPRPTSKEPRWVDNYHYAHYWPYPQNCEDRNSVTNALSLQVANGWVDSTTLYHYHFDPESQQLNTSGMAHLEYILFRTPVQRRTVYIQMSPSAQIDQTRLASVQNTAGALSQSGGIPSIVMRRARAYGTSAEEVDVMTRKYISSSPSPRLPVGGGTSGGGGGSGSGGGSNSNE